MPTEEPRVDLTRQWVAAELLRLTKVESLREEARRNLKWAGIYRGFRPESLSRTLLLRAAPAFAADPAQLRSLGTVFLDSIEAPPGKDLAARFAGAAELSALGEEIKALCSKLSGQDIGSLPRSESGDPRPGGRGD